MNGGVGERPLPNSDGGILGVSQQAEALPQSQVSAIHFAGSAHTIQTLKVETDKKPREETHSRQVAATITKSSSGPIHDSGTSLAGKAPAVVQEGHLRAMGVPAVVLEARVQAVAGPVLSEKEKILQEGMQKLQSALQNLLAFDPSKPLNPTPTNIQDRMNQLCVPGVGIAVIYKGVVVPLGFGELTNTKLLSQAASDSKTIAALTVLSLVDEGILNLEDDVGEILGADLWARIDTDKLTIDELDQEGRVVGEMKPKVTILNLLSHTAETNIGGFGGYDKAGERKIPTTVDEILEEVRLLSKPDIQHHEYSGGGYEILRKIIELKVGSYEKAVQARVFDKLGMKESTYCPKEGAATANGNDPTGRPLPGGSFVYPQLAAAGLWTTPAELAQVVIGIQHACEQDGGVISKATAKEMLTSRTVDKPNGLGVFVEAMKNSTVFFHPGANAG
ncbi:MAG: beta-lactamase family protein, partial [Verrucomicrobia bacterium]|nr:beta-lactamase family protein [Verrucomicrobiota bacterium]